MNSIDTKNPVMQIEDGAFRFLLSTLNTLTNFQGDYDLLKIDVNGGIASGQWEMVFIQSRESLLAGICTYILSKGFELPKSPFLQMRLLEIIETNTSQRYQTARELLFACPKKPEEIKMYSENCFHFIENELGMDKYWEFGNNRSNDEIIKYFSALYGFGQALLNVGFNTTTQIPVSKTSLDNQLRTCTLRKELLPKMSPYIFKEKAMVLENIMQV